MIRARTNVVERALARQACCSPAAGNRKPGAWPALLFLVCLLIGSFTAQGATEHEVKAAFLFNFLKFVEWPGPPASTNTPIVIGVIGESPLREALPKILDGQTVKGRSIRMVSLQPGEPVGECQLLFVAQGKNEEMEEVLKAVKGKPILTVGESPEFIQRGGMINFVIVDQKVRFEINTAALDAVGLRADSRLLAVARRVKV